LEPRLIVGLGNVGKDYAQTRHNFGFLVVSQLARQHQLKFKRSVIHKGFVAQGRVNDQKVFLLLPRTFMNNSGLAVRSLMRQKKIALKDILVVHDDLDMDFGRLRLRDQGSAAGHKGVESVMIHCRSKEFARLKCGIGRSLGKKEMIDYVLSDFPAKEKKKLPLVIQEALACCEVWLAEGIEKAMNQFNRKTKENNERS